MGRQDIVKTNITMDLMIEEVIKELVPENKKGRINWVIHKVPNIKGDINALRQVWINLISNAVKYSGNQQQPLIEIGSFAENGQTVFFVKDNGVGFDEKYKEKLFKVFQRLHSVEDFEGTGVGLAIVEKIVSKHGGKVFAEGKVNEGATFYFKLPAS
jgi:light-regulated signal transduction histidine kinase (bacteriophytochrome)